MHTKKGVLLEILDTSSIKNTEVIEPRFTTDDSLWRETNLRNALGMMDTMV